MAQTTLSVRMDMDVKKQLDALCADVGMSTSTAINMFAKAFIRERRLPFEVKASEPNETTYAAMKAADEDEDMYGPFDTVSAMMEALNA